MATQRLERPSPPAGFVPGASIDLKAWHGSDIAVDESGRAYCFLGYRKEQQPNELPYYAPSVALHDRDGRGSFRFVRLDAGTLARSPFLRDDGFYRKLDDKWLILPRGAESYFGVIRRDNREEDPDLTRALFGGTSEEIESVAIALAAIVGRKHHEFLRLPRLTFSKTRNNNCDFSGCLIPRNFPYIAFEDAQYDWSHISLHGFYRLISFLCGQDNNNRLWLAIIESGIEEHLLRRIVANTNATHEPLRTVEIY